jgi:hypothetical protein
MLLALAASMPALRRLASMRARTAGGRPRRGPWGLEAPRERASRLPVRSAREADLGAGKSWYVRVILTEGSVGLEVEDLAG